MIVARSGIKLKLAKKAILACLRRPTFHVPNQMQISRDKDIRSLPLWSTHEKNSMFKLNLGVCYILCSIVSARSSWLIYFLLLLMQLETTLIIFVNIESIVRYFTSVKPQSSLNRLFIIFTQRTCGCHGTDVFHAVAKNLQKKICRKFQYNIFLLLGFLVWLA